MGYHRPVSSFNIGKKGEYLERRFFTEDAADERVGGLVGGPDIPVRLQGAPA